MLLLLVVYVSWSKIEDAVFGGSTVNDFLFWPYEAFNIKLKDTWSRWFIYLSWHL